MSPEALNARAAPRAGAAYWLNRRRCGDMSAEDIRAFDVWLARDKANRAAYEKAERVWAVLGSVVDDPAIIASRERNARALARRARTRWAGVFAGGLALAGAAAWVLAPADLLEKLSALAGRGGQELRTEIGQRATVTLRDHSVVTLDTSTIIRLRETPWERRIELIAGRAHFEVAKDRARPFIVAAAGKTVRATGTAFDVRVDANRFEVTLEEGRVRVESAKGPENTRQRAEMRAGWRLNVAGDQQWRIEPVDVTREASWRRGLLNFSVEPLESAVAEMNRYSKRKIVLGEDVENVIVGGVFDAGDIDSFVTAIEMNKLARVREETEDRIELGAIKK